MSQSREFDVLLWGATGFTGGLVAEYLARHHSGLRLALGGRNRSKLEDVKRGLAKIVDPKVADALPLVVADPSSREEMAAVARRAQVVASTAGPFAAYGKELLRGCAHAGTHYCDITGEVTFVRWAIDELDATARASGARLVSCCGFDSIPSDLGVLVAHEALVARGSALRAAELCVVSATGGVSGGTAASMMLLLSEAAADPAVRSLVEDPYALDPKGGRRGSDRETYRAEFDAELGKWTAPFLMRAVNARVVRRTNALLDFAFGDDFHYDERVAVGRGGFGRARASAMALGMRLGPALLRSGAARSLAQKRLPKPGEGPTREQRERGKFVIKIAGTGRGGEKVTVTVRGQQDPGYGETSKMLGETAVELLATGPARAGVLTPAVALGMPLVERLRRAGMTFDVS